MRGADGWSCHVALPFSRDWLSVGVRVVAGVGDLTRVLTGAIDDGKLLAAPSRREEDDVPSVGSDRWTLVRTDAVGELTDPRVREVVDTDVVAGARLHGEQRVGLSAE